jgi:hypothetical protein
LECFVLAMMDVRRRPTTRHIVRFDRAEHAAGAFMVRMTSDAQVISLTAAVRNFDQFMAAMFCRRFFLTRQQSE